MSYKKEKTQMTATRWLVLAVLLTLVPTGAWAECSWILWAQHLEKDKRSPQETRVWWLTLDSYTSRPACEAGKEVLPTDAKTWERSGILTSFLCLPDTVDPRGPKAAVR